MRLIDVEAIFLEARQINDSEVRAARGHSDFCQLLDLPGHTRLLCRVSEIEQSSRVAAVRSWLTQVVEASPDKLAGCEGKCVESFEFNIGRPRPPRRIKIVRANLKIGSALALVVAHRKEIFPARAHRRRGLAGEEWNGGIGLTK